MKRFQVIFFLFLFTTEAPHLRADVVEGFAALRKKDYATAKEQFEKAAAEGEPKAMHFLATMYLEGLGVEQDAVKAVDLLKQAADKGLRISQYNLGAMYHRGDRVRKDIRKAVEYYTKAAEQGDVQASNNLGYIFRNGEGVQVDMGRTFEYYKEAAEGGYIPAFNEFGLLYAQGIGAPQDFIEAYAWLSLAVKFGDPHAKANLVVVEQSLGDRYKKEAEQRFAEVQKLIESKKPQGEEP